MHLPSLLPWLVVAGSVVGHPTTLVARDSRNGERRNKDGESGGGIGRILTIAGAAFGAGFLAGSPVPKVWRSPKQDQQGPGLVQNQEPGLKQGQGPQQPHLGQDRRKPDWVEKYRAYHEQDEKQQDETGHRLLREMGWTDEELARMNQCIKDHYDIWMKGVKAEFSPGSSEYSRESVAKWAEAEVFCLRREALDRWHIYQNDQRKQQEAEAQRKGGDRSEFSLNMPKLPNINPAAALAAMRSGLSKSFKAAPKQMKPIR
ncbi:MAG: hypothetical protein M1823_003965 [Watsoniomyces obsoletus]|nr:MAG: hypothetical protein M1823_003965 [Watsoniomyces obsoletus]